MKDKCQCEIGRGVFIANGIAKRKQQFIPNKINFGFTANTIKNHVHLTYVCIFLHDSRYGILKSRN